MPRLSIIVPHRRDNQKLENTLVSVLENRPRDAEVIVVHDGGYSDPYQLGDEVVFVRASAGADYNTLLNEGVLAACSPLVNTLQEGVVVSAGWANQPIDQMQSDSTLAAVSVALNFATGVCFGIPPLNRDRLCSRGWMSDTPELSSAAPLTPHLACGFFRKSTQIALGGFRGDSPVAAALDFQLAAERAGIPTIALPDIRIDATQCTSAPTPRFLGRLCTEYELMPGGLFSALVRAPRSLYAQPAALLGWVQGCSSADVNAIKARLLRFEQERDRRAVQDAAYQPQHAWPKAA